MAHPAFSDTTSTREVAPQESRTGPRRVRTWSAKHALLSNLLSPLRGRLSSATHPQGLPPHRLLYCLRRAQAGLSALLTLYRRRESLKRPFPEPFAASIGMDWADAKPDIWLQGAEAERRERRVLRHPPEPSEEWARTLQQRFHGQPIAVGLELAKGPIVSALQKYACFLLFPVNPATGAKSRQAFTPSRAKDDPTDAELQLALLLRHREKLQPLIPQSPTLRALQHLVEARRRQVGETVRITNRLTSTAWQKSLPSL